MTQATPAPLKTIARFMVSDLGTAYAWDQPEHEAPRVVAGVFDAVIEASGASEHAAFLALVFLVQAAGWDASPLVAIAGRYTDTAPAELTEAAPAWLVERNAIDGRALWRSFAVSLDSGAPADVPALLPFVRYLDEHETIERTRGPVTTERVMMPRMAYAAAGGCEVSACEVEGLEPMTRVTLHASAVGTLIEWTSGGPTDEGYSNTGETIRQSEDEDGRPCWEISGACESRDCDGRMSRGWDGVSYGGPGGRCSSIYPSMADRSEQGDRRTSYRDHQAEAAGY